MTNKKKWLSIALILCVAGILMFTFLGTYPLLDPDEPVYAETAREMLQFQDFISPRIYGDFWYDKPPMYYWLVAAAFKIFGIGEFAARFPSALLAVSGAVLVYLSGRELFNERAGLLAALVLATSLEYFYLGNAAVTDMTLTFFLTAALLSFLHRKYYLLYGSAALAVVTKGPVGIFFCGVIIILYLVLTGKLTMMKRMKVVSGGVLFALIALPWYAAMYSLHGMAFIDTFLGFHNVTRFLQPEHAAGAIWYYYTPVLILGFFPWSAFLVQAFFTGLKEKGEYHNTCVFLVIWAAVVFLFFSISQTKLVSYILPMYPPLALLVGYYFDKAWAEEHHRALKYSASVFGIVAALLISGLVYAGTVVMAELMPSVKIMTVILAVLAVSVLFQSFRRNFRAVFTTYVLGMMIFLVFLMSQALPVITSAFSVQPFVNEFKQHYDGQAPVYVAKFYRPGLMYYSGMAGAELSQEELAAVAAGEKDRAYFIMKKKNYEKLSPEIQNKLHLLVVREDKTLLIRENN
ncbi:MAG TPA: glycosyltransferase family 39 protein [Methylomusa anaerophila]|uniref:Undecaprenyl phosphate-alpha-4-amino-4-deoxy-L-arabinose arabinosyl transferase n=1 Tax=Methylomusa anaerophila TaxID=1930071 RepID=A0A348ANC8_9FIRM|nr:glycosyltransferase family 39 protein [Methylomusa anaerophila]BBB92576.1 undecaprenyl phosphate-alpha-4-amino-4-deoxy-L-arabinose arabinosyl transferase [Methylomusa anaerophila]HML87570.1 glycosyltransferase family 39 protein [Methylomusa anaerophila]